MLGTAFEGVLAAARAGDPAAWASLLDELSGPLLGFARGRGLDDPEDVVGDTLLHVARGLDGFRGDEQGFRAWVFTIAHRRVVDAVRRGVRRPLTPLPSDELVRLADAVEVGDDAIEAALERLDGDRRLAELLAHLTDEQREVLVLRYVVDLDATAVGTMTGRSTNAVAAITRRALHRLEEVLDAAVDAAAVSRGVVRHLPTAVDDGRA